MEIKNIYKQLTNVDIEEQKKLWNERGKGYYGEYLVFCELYSCITGNCKILMNLELPTSDKKTTEIDLIMIHETGIYVFEIKHFKGTIYGDDTGEIWTQYFRTSENHVFKNPIKQNAYHIDAVKKMFPNIPVYSVVVFTSDFVDLRINHTNPDVILCKLSYVCNTLRSKFENKEISYTIDKIDLMFRRLVKYSKMNDEVNVDSETASFYSWLTPTIDLLEKNKKQLEDTNQQLIIKQKRIFPLYILNLGVSLFIIVIILISSILIVNRVKVDYKNKTDNMEQILITVDEIKDDYTSLVNEIINVNEVKLNELSSNSVSFEAVLENYNNTYNIFLNGDSKYIVMTDDEKIYEFDVFGNNLSYNQYNNTLGKNYKQQGKLKQSIFVGVSKKKIKYIKLTNISLFTYEINKKVIAENLELELYRK